MDWNQFLDAAQHGGLIGFLLFIIFAGYRRWWVWGYQLTESDRKAQMWQDLALRNMSATDNAIAIAEAIHSQSGTAGKGKS